MPKLTPFEVVVSKKETVLDKILVVPLVKHAGGAGPNWTLEKDRSPAGRNTVKFTNKKSVKTYFERKFPESAGYSIEYM